MSTLFVMQFAYFCVWSLNLNFFRGRIDSYNACAKGEALIILHGCIGRDKSLRAHTSRCANSGEKICSL